MYSNHKTKIESTDILKTDMRESEMRRGTHGSPTLSPPPSLPLARHGTGPITLCWTNAYRAGTAR